LLFLVKVLYTPVYLARLGSGTDMLDQPRGLLPWIASNEGAYLGLWGICLASLLCLLPVVPTLYRCTPATGSAIAPASAIADPVAGVIIGIVGAAANAASSSSRCSTVAVNSPGVKARGFSFPAILQVFTEWAMLGSNQRPLPCEGSVIACWSFLELAKFLQIHRFFALDLFPAFQEIYSGCCTVAAHP